MSILQLNPKSTEGVLDAPLETLTVTTRRSGARDSRQPAGPAQTEDAPFSPRQMADFTRAGLPWFKDYDAEDEALDGPANLADLDSLVGKSIKTRAEVIADAGPIGTPKVKPLAPARAVREGEGEGDREF